MQNEQKRDTKAKATGEKAAFKIAERTTKQSAEKRKLRKEVLSYREAMPDREWQEKSAQIMDRVLQLPAFQRAEHILCYVNYKKEVETLTLIRECLDLKKRVYCPCVMGAEMDFYEIADISELSEGFHGILEPARSAERLFHLNGQEQALMLMPGAVFDRAHHRIGYGGGYYDRYLKRYFTALQKCQTDRIESQIGSQIGSFCTAALSFAFQVREQIPYEEHDICPQLIITETGCIS